jgi:hypothetical protein
MRVNCSRLGSIVVLTVLIGLAGGCGSSGDDTGATSAATGPTQAATTEAAGSGCADAQPEIEASLTGMSAVTSVDVPSCDQAVVSTSLGADEGELAASFCQNAASEARPHGVAAVSVVSSDGTELARGTDATDCRAAS